MSKLTKALTAAAGNAGESLYVEDVFSTYLYDGTGATQTITNGIDLAGEGGMTWIKCRNTAFNNIIFDTERGAPNALLTNTTDANISSYSDSLTSFNSDGFTLGADTLSFSVNNGSNRDYASWSFRKAEKFFDVVTYTGDGVSGRAIPHNLGATPAVMIVKKTSGTYNWQIYHSSIGATKFLEFTTGAAQTSSAVWNDTAPTDSVFTVGNEYGVNQSGDTYVAYLFASDAGGFGDDGSENIIKCGSYTGNSSSSGPEIDLGFEPQWVMVKNTSSAGRDWCIFDNMRGIPVTASSSKYLKANTAESEQTLNGFYPTATGFRIADNNGQINSSPDNYIYIAIRRPMKTPESGTEVFQAGTRQSTSPGFVSDFPVDMFMRRYKTGAGYPDIGSRLQGARAMQTSETFAESPDSGSTFDYMNGYYTSVSSDTNHFSWMFKRATGFMDVVAYTGTGVAKTEAHNLGVAPELMIVKRRNSSRVWAVWASGIDIDDYLTLNGSAGVATFGLWQSTLPTATQITLGTDASVNGSGDTYIAYLFASVAGVSKVGSYTGTGSNLNVDCGFSAGARFILIKRSDSTGDWYVYDSVRGIVAGNDPYLLLNSTAAEVTNTDYIDPLSSGFTVTSSAPAALNASGGTYIFLAIA